MRKWGRLRGRRGTHPCEANDCAPDETIPALVPDGHAEGGVGGQSVHADEDVGGGEVEAKGSQGRGRTRICGHWETGLIRISFLE